MKWLKNLVIKIAVKKVAKKMGLEDSMEGNKPWYRSKGVLTGIVTVLIGTYEAVAVSLAPEFGWKIPEIPGLVFTILGALGIYARKVANTKIG